MPGRSDVGEVFVIGGQAAYQEASQRAPQNSHMYDMLPGHRDGLLHPPVHDQSGQGIDASLRIEACDQHAVRTLSVTHSSQRWMKSTSSTLDSLVCPAALGLVVSAQPHLPCRFHLRIVHVSATRSSGDIPYDFVIYERLPGKDMSASVTLQYIAIQTKTRQGCHRACQLGSNIGEQMC